MIHIILAILKIVGILLAVLLGLVLLILLTVLFLPLRYRICAEKQLAVWHPEGKSRLPEWADILCTADFRKKDRFR